MPKTLIDGIDDLRARVGQELGVGDWVALDQPLIDRFSEVTGDHDWIHVDCDRARNGPYGVAIAHGLMTLAMIGGLIQQIYKMDRAYALNYGLNRVRFPNVVRAGARIRLRVTLAGIEEIGDEAVRAILRATVEVEGEAKPACVADLVFQYMPPER